MAKGLRVRFQDAVTEFALEKVERSRLYGSKRRSTVDTDGRLCSRASLTEDGQVLLRSGMSAQGYFDAHGQQVDTDDIRAVDADGTAVELVPSTLGVEQSLVGPVDPRDVLDLSLTAVYRLTASEFAADLRAALDGGAVFRAPFNYRADFRAESAFLLANTEGVFALVGVPAPARWLEPNAPPPVDEDADDDELDFEMF
jgi:hypothetical protein